MSSSFSDRENLPRVYLSIPDKYYIDENKAIFEHSPPENLRADFSRWLEFHGINPRRCLMPSTITRHSHAVEVSQIIDYDEHGNVVRDPQNSETILIHHHVVFQGETPPLPFPPFLTDEERKRFGF